MNAFIPPRRSAPWRPVYLLLAAVLLFAIAACVAQLAPLVRSVAP
jgi:hypothetical protein